MQPNTSVLQLSCAPIPVRVPKLPLDEEAPPDPEHFSTKRQDRRLGAASRSGLPGPPASPSPPARDRADDTPNPRACRFRSHRSGVSVIARGPSGPSTRAGGGG